MLTMKQWNESKKPFSEFATIGETVDEEIVDYFIEVMPPIVSCGKSVQMGEPYDHQGENGKARYLTLEKIDGEWTYTGKKVALPKAQLM